MDAKTKTKTPTKTKPQLFHATMLVTRTEEWCVEAANAEEAKARLRRGDGHRCTSGEIHSAEVGEIL
jgi:hypothetical protein